MPNAIQTVEGNGHGQTELDQHFGEQRQRTKRRRNRGRLQMPADNGRDQVRRGVDVERARGDRARDSVQSTRVPGDLGTVDGQVRSDRSVQALLGEDLGRVGCVGGGCRPV